jgi:hypothetical protein
VATTRTDALRLASGFILLGLLPRLLGPAARWRLFGSWAILLQSTTVTRLPNDVDIQLHLDGASTPGDLRDWVVPAGAFSLRSTRARAIKFSDPRVSPASFWQTVEVLHGNKVVFEETVNWVSRGSQSDRDATLDARSDSFVDPRKCHTFSLAAHGFPELLGLPLQEVPVASREECVAQKWTRIAMPRTGGRRHTRWQDMADVYDLVLGAHASLDQALLVAWLTELARTRGLEWPFHLSEPPLEWLDFWDSYNFRSGISRPSPGDCAQELNAYLAGASHEPA